MPASEEAERKPEPMTLGTAQAMQQTTIPSKPFYSLKNGSENSVASQEEESLSKPKAITTCFLCYDNLPGRLHVVDGQFNLSTIQTLSGGKQHAILWYSLVFTNEEYLAT